MHLEKNVMEKKQKVHGKIFTKSRMKKHCMGFDLMLDKIVFEIYYYLILPETEIHLD